MKTLKQEFDEMVRMSFPENLHQYEIDWAKTIFFAGAAAVVANLNMASKQSGQQMISKQKSFEQEIFEHALLTATPANEYAN